MKNNSITLLPLFVMLSILALPFAIVAVSLNLNVAKLFTVFVFIVSPSATPADTPSVDL